MSWIYPVKFPYLLHVKQNEFDSILQDQTEQGSNSGEQKWICSIRTEWGIDVEHEAVTCIWTADLCNSLLLMTGHAKPLLQHNASASTARPWARGTEKGKRGKWERKGQDVCQDVSLFCSVLHWNKANQSLFSASLSWRQGNETCEVRNVSKNIK